MMIDNVIETSNPVTSVMNNIVNAPTTLTEEQKAAIAKIKRNINISDTEAILSYGSDPQQGVIALSERATQGMSTKNLGFVGEIISDVRIELRRYDKTAKGNILQRLFSTPLKKIERIKSGYQNAQTNIRNIENAVESNIETLQADIEIQEGLFEENKIRFQDLTLYVIAGLEKLEEETTLFEKMKDESRGTQDPEILQTLRDTASQIKRFEKKIHDLELSRVVCVQMAPQIRMVQGNDIALIEKLKSAIVTTLPLWRSQMLLNLGLANSELAVKVGNEIDSATNALLLQNSQMLKTTSIEVAKAVQRPIINIDTIKKTMKDTIDTFLEVQKVEEEARQQRTTAKNEMSALTANLNTIQLDSKNQLGSRKNYKALN
ncbi:MAG: toxic anion resistance protein [Candidatus Peribacteria bacterium]|jgi:uncharacterized protein YaaN involved in tellurite resistance|nr:toxic anion resistance protein [Candidatus Peribacteria bacterium]